MRTEHTGSYTDQSGKQRHLLSDQITRYSTGTRRCAAVLANVLYVRLSCSSGCPIIPSKTAYQRISMVNDAVARLAKKFCELTVKLTSGVR